MAQRLGQLEEMMARLVERIMPESKSSPGKAGSQSGERRKSTTPSESEDGGLPQTLESLEASVIEDTPVGLLLGLRAMNTSSGSPSDALTPESGQTSAPAGVPPVKANPPKYEKASKTLHALFPAQQDIDIIVNTTPGAFFIMSQFFCFRDVLEGTAEPSSNMAIIPSITTHPAALARRLLGLSICMQQLPPNFDFQQLQLKASVPRTMVNIIAVVHDLVASNDDIVATAEGLQCLILQGIWHSNAGNLRKAWLSYRRALSFAQLIGIDRGNSQALRFVDAEVPQRISAEHLWYRIVACDRSLSLLLGLPVGSADNTFASDENMVHNTQMERLEKWHTVAAAKIVERNNNKTSQAYAMTQTIDCDLEVAALTLGKEWWQEPAISTEGTTLETIADFLHITLQIHHYDLLLLLHLPFMLRDPTDTRYDYSKVTCARASREVLTRYITFRNLVSGAYSCRHVDYSGLIAAMTLLLTYLRQSPAQPIPSCAQRSEDRKLVEVVRERMQHIAVLNHDKLSQESADIIGQMLPILDSVDGSMNGGDVSECGATAIQCFHLNIPYLGTVNIFPRMNEKTPAEDTGAPGALPTAPLNMYNMNAMPTPASQPSVDGTTSLPDSMDLASFDHSMVHNIMNGMSMEFEPQTQTDVFEFPGLTAEAEDWTFQGVDTTYWSLLNNSAVGESL